MQSGWRVGSLLGIPFYIDYSWLPIAALMVYFQGPIITVGLFASVLAHELAHSWVAMAQGIKVNSITLFIFGGMAAIEREASTPKGAFAVAAAGPAFSLGLFGFLSLLRVAGILPLSATAGSWILAIAQINLVLGVFNLLPGLPLDGGQMLKACIWGWTGSRRKGTLWAARAGQLVGYGLLALGLLMVFRNSLHGWWLGFIGLFIVNNARGYLQYSQLQQSLSNLTAGEVMTRNFRVLDVHMSLREFVERYLLLPDRLISASATQATPPPTNTPAETYFAEDDGRYKGMVIPEMLRSIERSLWDQQDLSAMLKPMDQLQGVSETDSVTQVISLMRQNQMRQIPVLTPTGAIAGLVDKGDVVAGLAKRLGFSVAPEVLQRIREQNEFPPGFPSDDGADTPPA